MRADATAAFTTGGVPGDSGAGPCSADAPASVGEVARVVVVSVTVTGFTGITVSLSAVSASACVSAPTMRKSSSAESTARYAVWGVNT